jgi:Kef-type K+ transport system membrane component KefB
VPPVVLFILQIAVILALSRLATPIARRLGQPPVIAEMVAGLMLGPSLLGWVAPEVSAALFPAASLNALSVHCQFGISLFMFIVGWRLEIETLKSVGRMARVTSIVSIAVPFALGSAVAVFAWYP